MDIVEELVETDTPVREVARRARHFDMQQVKQRLEGAARVEAGREGTVLLVIKGLTVGLVQPGDKLKSAAGKALRDVEADVVSRKDHQGVVFFPWNVIIRPSPEGAKRLARSAITYRVAPEARTRDDQPDILTSVGSFLRDWEGRRDRSIDHLRSYRQALRSHIAKTAASS